MSFPKLSTTILCLCEVTREPYKATHRSMVSFPRLGSLCKVRVVPSVRVLTLVKRLVDQLKVKFVVTLQE